MERKEDMLNILLFSELQPHTLWVLTLPTSTLGVIGGLLPHHCKFLKSSLPANRGVNNAHIVLNMTEI